MNGWWHLSLRPLFEVGVRRGDDTSFSFTIFCFRKEKKSLGGMVRGSYLCRPLLKSWLLFKRLSAKTLAKQKSVLNAEKKKEKFWQQCKTSYLCTPNRKTGYTKQVL